MVIYIRGLYSNFKHGSFFGGNSILILKLLIVENNQKLQSIGLRIRSVTNDQETEFYSCSQLLEVSPEKTYFFVGASKIYYIFDPPHLFKSTRNKLLHNNFIWKNENNLQHSAFWSYILDFYNLDKFIKTAYEEKSKEENKRKY